MRELEFEFLSLTPLPTVSLTRQDQLPGEIEGTTESRSQTEMLLSLCQWYACLSCKLDHKESTCFS